MNTVPLPVQIIPRKLSLPNLSVYYPFVAGQANPAAMQIMNNTILSLANQLIHMQGYFQNPLTQVTGWFEVKTNEREVLSLNLGTYGYPPKAAHGMTYIKSLTFDTRTGHAYQLHELFTPGSDYVKRLSDIIKKQIAQRKIQLINDFEGIRPDQDYYIADKALVIYFQLYEITPYVFGFPMFPISVYDLQDIVREGSPLAKMATND